MAITSKAKIVLLIMMVMLCLPGFTQQHDLKNCRLNKKFTSYKWDTENSALTCPVCREKQKKEHAARVAERNQVADRKTAQVKAKRLEEARSLAEAQKKKRKEEEKRKSEGQVTVANPQNTASPRKNTRSEPAHVKGLLYIPDSEGRSNVFSLYAHLHPANYIPRARYFLIGGDTVLKDRFSNYYGFLSGMENASSFPENIGIVNIRGTADDNGYQVCDIVDVRGTRLIKDDNIKAVFHFYGDWFVLVHQRFGRESVYSNWFKCTKAELYNYKTRERVEIERRIENNAIPGLEVTIWYTALLKPDGNYGVNRAAGSFKAALPTQSAHRQLRIYYLTNNGRIESEIP